MSLLFIKDSFIKTSHDMSKNGVNMGIYKMLKS
jgi:hypothetical protein